MVNYLLFFCIFYYYIVNLYLFFYFKISKKTINTYFYLKKFRQKN